jgi:hypothetical protein
MNFLRLSGSVVCLVFRLWRKHAAGLGVWACLCLTGCGSKLFHPASEEMGNAGVSL